jgi:hypothetical protein
MLIGAVVLAAAEAAGWIRLQMRMIVSVIPYAAAMKADAMYVTVPAGTAPVVGRESSGTR